MGQERNIGFHCHTDNTQLYISVSPEDFSSMVKLLDCISDLNTWMDTQLPPAKSRQDQGTYCWSQSTERI